jgi:murein DD-endopeptidase MepM/ murein hydrolase activator NlpD
MSKFEVSNGQDVSQGEIIGLVGCTGSCTGDHLHFEVRINGTPVDPLKYLP